MRVSRERAAAQDSVAECRVYADVEDENIIVGSSNRKCERGRKVSDRYYDDNNNCILVVRVEDRARSPGEKRDLLDRIYTAAHIYIYIYKIIIYYYKRQIIFRLTGTQYNIIWCVCVSLSGAG